MRARHCDEVNQTEWFKTTNGQGIIFKQRRPIVVQIERQDMKVPTVFTNTHQHQFGHISHNEMKEIERHDRGYLTLCIMLPPVLFECNSVFEEIVIYRV